MEFPVELKNSRKGLINMENKDEKGFLWCHVRPISSSKEDSERTKKTDKKLLKNLIMMKLSFPCEKKILARLKWKNNRCKYNVFCHENKFAFPIHVSDQKFENTTDLLLLIDDDKSYYLYIKDFDRFMFHKTKNGYVVFVYSVLVVKVYW